METIKPQLYFQAVITSIEAALTTSGSFAYRVTADSVAVTYFFVERGNNGEGQIKLKQTITGLRQNSYTLTIHAGSLNCDTLQVAYYISFSFHLARYVYSN